MKIMRVLAVVTGLALAQHAGGQPVPAPRKLSVELQDALDRARARHAKPPAPAARPAPPPDESVPVRIPFAPDSAELAGNAPQLLAVVAVQLRESPGARLNIDVHTDRSGSPARDMELSSRRAAAVMKHLVEAERIGADRLTAHGFGSQSPRYDERTPAGRRNNERVEFVLLR